MDSGTVITADARNRGVNTQSFLCKFTPNKQVTRSPRDGNVGQLIGQSTTSPHHHQRYTGISQ